MTRAEFVELASVRVLAALILKSPPELSDDDPNARRIIMQRAYSSALYAEGLAVILETKMATSEAPSWKK